MWSFAKPKPTPPGVIIRNVLGEEIDRVESVYHLAGADLRRRQWPHADLSGLSLDGANCEGINLFGARLIGTFFCGANLRNAELSFGDATCANFQNAKLECCLMYRSETLGAHFDQAIISPASDIPGMRVVVAST
jgi:uncharacterized protein YjbI with pentapeptide repeats